MRFLFLFLIIFPAKNGFSQELHSFTSNGLYGYKSGKSVVVPAKYSYAADFKGGRAAVCINGKWGFIDTNGKLVIPLEFERVESFGNGFARFYAGNKIGLLDSTGKKVVPAYCDEIQEYNKIFYLSIGEKKGIYVANEKTLIEPGYSFLWAYDHFIYGEYDTGYDVYTISGKLIAQNIVAKSMLLTENGSSYICDLSWLDSMCFVNKYGDKVSQTYQYISNDYCDISVRENSDSIDTQYLKIYLLHLQDEPGKKEISGTPENSDKFHLLYGEHFLTDGEYFDYRHENDITLVSKDKTCYRIEKNGSFTQTKYLKSVQVNEYTLLYLSGGSVDVIKIKQLAKVDYYTRDPLPLELQPDTIFIAHFDDARVVYSETVSYDYYGNMQQTYYSYPSYIIEVKGTNENSEKWALYDLETKKYCTAFDDRNKLLINKLNAEKACCVFQDKQSGLMAYNCGDFQSGYEFSESHLTWMNDAIFLNRSDSSGILLTGKKNVAKIEFPNARLVNSMEIIEPEEPVYSEITGEYESGDYPKSVFSFPFDIFETYSEPKKYGFLDENDRVVFPQYDELLAYSDTVDAYCNIPVIGTRQNELYGFYNLRTGIEVKPQFKKPLDFKYDPIRKLMYAQPEGEKYYLTDSGKKIYSVEQTPEIFTENKKQGLFMVNDFTLQQLEDGERMQVLPAVFRSITEMENLPYFIAENQSGRKGMVNYAGDTLIPFEFDALEQGYFSRYSYPSDPYIIVWKKGKMGLYFANLPNKPVAKYDRIDSLTLPYYGNNVFIVASDHKSGLLNNEAEEVLPCNYSNIDILMQNEVNAIVALKPEGVNIFYYYDKTMVNTTSDILELDFVIGSNGFRKVEGGYAVFDIFSGIFSQFTEQLNGEIPESDYEIFEKDGLLGFRDATTKKVVLSPRLKYIRLNEANEYLSFEKDGSTIYKTIGQKK